MLRLSLAGVNSRRGDYRPGALLRRVRTPFEPWDRSSRGESVNPRLERLPCLSTRRRAGTQRARSAHRATAKINDP
jgi:hypothetical protein